MTRGSGHRCPPSASFSTRARAWGCARTSAAPATAPRTGSRSRPAQRGWGNCSGRRFPCAGTAWGRRRGSPSRRSRTGSYASSKTSVSTRRRRRMTRASPSSLRRPSTCLSTTPLAPPTGRTARPPGWPSSSRRASRGCFCKGSLSTSRAPSLSRGGPWQPLWAAPRSRARLASSRPCCKSATGSSSGGAWSSHSSRRGASRWGTRLWSGTRWPSRGAWRKRRRRGGSGSSSQRTLSSLTTLRRTQRQRSAAWSLSRTAGWASTMAPTPPNSSRRSLATAAPSSGTAPWAYLSTRRLPRGPTRWPWPSRR
mmetsp:Transcript_23975/g.60675  ORF Transcript_23975/g.60675 Transcript_23975/m.60675 type:complete len:310 (+) Transcript_23975:332-1261(+)